MRRKIKNIILGVSSSVACFKAPSLAGIFVKKELAVKTVLTPAAARLISPVLFNAVTADEVFVEMFVPDRPMYPNHISLSKWADLFVIAPATANTIGKLASGICDNLLTTLAVSRRVPLYIAPAMESAMWKNSAVARNVDLLKKEGIKFIGPERGRLASGSSGIGRMSEPEEIARRLPL